MPMITTIAQQSGDTPSQLLADAGSCSNANLAAIADTRIDAYISTRRQQHGERLGPYQLQEIIGAGSFGSVYKGLDARLDRTVAIKILKPSIASAPGFPTRFEREARAVAQLEPTSRRRSPRRPRW